MTEFKKKEIIMARTINGKTTTLALIGDYDEQNIDY